MKFCILRTKFNTTWCIVCFRRAWSLDERECPGQINRPKPCNCHTAVAAVSSPPVMTSEPQ